jgi:6-pyruvoyltetrahydropterin/6-carboxytetrahydropterin synthase
MRYEITKEFNFEAAHRLLRNYTGKCRNNHGHSYQAKLVLEGEILDEKDMLMDFSEAKRLQTWIDDNLDHVTLLWEEDPLIVPLREHGNRVLETCKNPTAEHIAELILEEAKRLFESAAVKIKYIEISETCTSAARVFA